MAQNPILTLDDLDPQEMRFSLSAREGKEYTFKKFTLKERIFVNKKWPNGEVEKVFQEMRVAEIAEIAYLLLKEKDAFPTFDDFCESAITANDLLAVVKGVLGTIGISEPVLQSLQNDVNAAKKT